MLVHPDKNKGSSLASEAFKKLQCAYEVIIYRTCMLVHSVQLHYLPKSLQAIEFLLALNFHVLQVLSDFTKKRDYDKQLGKEEIRSRSVCQPSHGSSHQVTYNSDSNGLNC